MIRPAALVKPTRRSFLKGGAAALAAPFIVPRSSLALPRGGNPLATAGLTAPAQAQAWGFTKLALYDDFINLSNIDLHNTHSAAFLWFSNWAQTAEYGGQFTPSGTGPLSPSGYSISSPSVLTIAPTGAADNDWLTMGSAVVTSATGVSVGQVFGGPGPVGAYYECVMQVPASLTDTASTPHPSFAPGENGYYCPGPPNRVELPGFEFEAGGKMYNAFTQGQSDYCTNNLNGYYNSNDDNSAYWVNDGAFHKLGILWVPMALNGGTGFRDVYIDDVLVPSSRVTYTASGAPSPGYPGAPNGSLSYYESQANAVNLCPGKIDPFIADKIAVWVL